MAASSADAILQKKCEKHHIKPIVNDVLFGRGSEARRHPGNARYRAIIKAHQKRYHNAMRHEKNSIAEEVASQVTEDGGKFVKYCECKNDWVLVNGADYKEKVKQSLRERPKRRKDPSSRKRTVLGNGVDKLGQGMETGESLLAAPYNGEVDKHIATSGIQQHHLSACSPNSRIDFPTANTLMINQSLLHTQQTKERDYLGSSFYQGGILSETNGATTAGSVSSQIPFQEFENQHLPESNGTGSSEHSWSAQSSPTSFQNISCLAPPSMMLPATKMPVVQKKHDAEDQHQTEIESSSPLALIPKVSSGTTSCSSPAFEFQETSNNISRRLLPLRHLEELPKCTATVIGRTAHPGEFRDVPEGATEDPLGMTTPRRLSLFSGMATDQLSPIKRRQAELYECVLRALDSASPWGEHYFEV